MKIERSYPDTRMRRIRKSSALREMLAETTLSKADLIQPIFIKEDLNNDIYQINYINFEYDIGRYLKSIDDEPALNVECANKIKSFFTRYP